MKKIIFLIAISFSLITTSCKKDFLDVNEDPSKAAEVPPKLLLPTIESQIAFAQGGDAARISGVFIQQFTGASRQFAQYQIYSVSPVDVNNLWRFNIYAGCLEDLHLLEQLSEEKNYPTYNGVSKILTAYTLGLTTDLWGDIPYSDAFKGTEQLSPKFDSQESIYASMQSLLDQAIVLLGQTDIALKPGAVDDLMFGGSKAAWITFAHSLKARYFLHLVKRNPSLANNAIAEVAKGFGSSDDDAVFTFGTSETSANPFYQFNGQRTDISYSGFLVDQMIATADPRLDAFADTSAAGGGAMGAFYGSISSPVDFMTYSELKFIEAEAQFRLNNAQAAADAFNDAVKASVLRITGAPDATFEANVASETSASISLEKIMNQKYVALYTSPEAWTDWRRTGFPVLTPVTAGGNIPRSFWYPSTEVSYNTNCPANTSLQRKVWWDN